MSEEQMNDSTFGRLFIIMIIAMTVLTIIIMVLASFASNDVNSKLDSQHDEENTQAIADRLAPVGSFSADTVAAAPAAPVVETVLSGEEAYGSCVACHGAGVAGAPAFGNKAAWADRITKGIDELYKNAIDGYQGSAGFMPAKGGNTALSDASVKAAVDYMVEAAK